MSSIACVQNNFGAYGTFDANHAPILRKDLHYLQTDRNELPLEPCHLGVPSDASKTISEPMVRLAQTVHQSCTDTNTVSKRIEMTIPHDPRHLAVPSRAFKTISEPMVRSAQIVHLSCVKSITISERAEISFHLSLVT